MHRVLFLFLIATLIHLPLWAQNTFLRSGDEEVDLLNRIETLDGEFSNRLFLDNPNVAKQDVFGFLHGSKPIGFLSNYSNVDYFNINRALSYSGEWSPVGDGVRESRRPVLGFFYKSEADFIRTNKSGVFFAFNPVLGVQGAYEKDRADFPIYSSAGIEMRGKIKDRLGLYFFGTHNYERPLAYQKEWIDRWEAIPGIGEYTEQGGAYQYLKLRGYADLALIKDHFSLSAGYDQHFIGSGMRSLFLSDFSEAAFFAALNTKIWRLNYRNIYLKLQPERFGGLPQTSGNKYAAVHHLSVNVRPWLNIGLFETVTFVRSGGYELGYLNPIVFYRAIERSMGSPDKVAIGLDAKALLLKRFNIYGQFLLNEFTAKEFFARNGYWANKWGVQLGLKYYNAFFLENLDLQLETNLVRPYTYTHSDRVRGEPIANFGHYNQALAHPLGAGFAELLGRMQYRPIPRLTIELRGLYYRQGSDTSGINLGNNIFASYRSRGSAYGVKLINGPEVNTLLTTLDFSYELRPRLFFDLGMGYRESKSQMATIPESKALFFSAGARLNLARTTRMF